MSIRFVKYHGLGNDYIVLNPADVRSPLSTERIRKICHRNYGVGSDGILLRTPGGESRDFTVQILNPDGSEAEKSGNGLRIFSRYLHDEGLVDARPFTIKTIGGPVTVDIGDGKREITVGMGIVDFHSSNIPVDGPPREVLNETIVVQNRKLTYCAATIGNPHCVILKDTISADEACRLGPFIENEPRFPNRTNVQFMKIIDRSNIQLEIWERGAGYTLASGSSACASAAVARKLGLCDMNIGVHMQGGNIDITVTDEFSVRMTGPVTRVCDGSIDEEIFDDREFNFSKRK